jgi:hypothetical protein
VPSLLIAYDTDYPEPLRSVRPIVDAFGVALVFAPQPSERTLRASTWRSPMPRRRRSRCPRSKRCAPAFRPRVLPLLDALAARRATRVVLDYLDDTRVQVDVAPADAAMERVR